MVDSKYSVRAHFIVVVSGINMVVILSSYNSPKPSKVTIFQQHFKGNINYLDTLKLKISIIVL